MRKEEHLSAFSENLKSFHNEILDLFKDRDGAVNRVRVLPIL